MARILFPALLMLATPAVAHEDAGFFHFHPHGIETAVAAVVLTVAGAVVLWRVLRGRR
ncbi:MAG: hypothetical protein HLUCCO18_14865 [Rhodobacteraceae bacterium HLUCCO18]|nr:MAG: hypothetical protein HLUCCO18_14865 [Rhodobacteraceae bacterium HLUCCO18]